MTKGDRTVVRGGNNRPTDKNEPSPTKVVGREHPPSSTPLPRGKSPTILNQRFVLEQEISRGGMGVVYKALDLRRQEARDRDEYVAVKVIGEEFLRQYDNAFISLQREARKAQKLAHPNIITVYDFDRDGDVVYMTMELLEGESLEEMLQKQKGNPVPFDKAFSIINGVGQALSYAHQQDVIHSDIKPANLFITKSGRVKVLDFGIATAMYKTGEETSATLFNPRQLGALTTAYAPIEMFAASKPDPRDDIYAFAVVCYEMLAGHHPFGKQSTLESMRQALEPKPIKHLNKAQWSALKTALQFQREKRTPSVELFLQGITTQEASFPVKLATGSILAILLLVFAGTQLYKQAEPFSDKAPSQPVLKSTNGATQAAAPPEIAEKNIVTEAPAPGNTDETDRNDLANTRQQPENKLSLTLTAPYPDYMVGDKFWFYTTTTDNSFLTCYYNDTNEILRIFPNRFQTNAYIEKGNRLEIPKMNTQQGFDITLDKAGITEKILCLATAEDISSRLPARIWGTDLEPLPLSSLTEIISTYKEISPNIAIDMLEITAKERNQQSK